MTEIIDINLQEILNHWDLELYRFEKICDVYKIYTQKGIKNLKVSPAVAARLQFVHQAVQHLTKKGFTQMYPLIPTVQGDTYIFDQHYAYSLFDWIEGRQSNYKNKKELIQSFRILADFHQKSYDFTAPLHSNMRNHLGKCLKHFEERHQDLLRFKEMARNDAHDPFAVTYLANINYFLPMAEKAIAKMKKSAYPRLVERAKITKPFCHGDPAARNFIITPNEEVFIIDFDSCRLDLPIMDLIKFTRRVMKKYRWRYSVAKLLIDNYQDIQPLTSSELEVMKAVFFFPQKFWRLAIRYFDQHTQYGPERLLRKFQKYVNNKDYLVLFQEQFENYQSFSGE
jgi:CotS family spore coat protein